MPFFYSISQIVDYLAMLYHKALDLGAARSAYQGLPRGDERTRVCDKEHGLLKELNDELPKLKDVFDPYLRFKVWK
jgi:hypothetical protein